MEFNCRECPVRQRCIQESDTSPSVRMIMRRAFEAGTDTQDMWGLLQMNCWLVRQEQQDVRPPRASLLGQRLKDETESVEAVEELKEKFEEAPPPWQEPATAGRPVQRPVSTRPKEAEGRKKDALGARYCLALRGGKHRIALPSHGEIVLGRFDPVTNVSPDVDLSYDDRNNRVVSRRHARIIGRRGRHEIEDLGSTNGTRVNGRRLEIGQRVRLHPGDRVSLGYCEFDYVPISEIQTSPQAEPPEAYLRVTFTGRRFPLPSWGEAVIGRSDPVVGLIPDIDLSQEEDASQVVARRHVRIIARDGRHYAEDLGSATGTKLNGVQMGIGERVPLNPGDHLWLGGCVLAYDVEQDVPGEYSFD